MSVEWMAPLLFVFKKFPGIPFDMSVEWSEDKLCLRARALIYGTSSPPGLEVPFCPKVIGHKLRVQDHV